MKASAARAYSWDFKFMDLQLDLNGEAEDPKRMMDLAAQSLRQDELQISRQ